MPRTETARRERCMLTQIGAGVGSKFIGSFTSATGQEEKLLMKGDWTDTTAEVTDEASGQQIAAIYRDRWNAREFFGGQQTYYLTVAPNVDVRSPIII